jgi:ATP synthase protein I
MWKIVSLQTFAVMAVALIAGIVSGRLAGLSAIFGGSAYVLPNALFAARLSVPVAQGQSTGVAFMAWALVKVILTVAILAAVARLYHGTHWPALLAGLFAPLVVNVFALLLRV